MIRNMGFNLSSGGPGISEKKFLDNSFFSVWDLSTARGPPSDLSELTLKDLQQKMKCLKLRVLELSS